MRAGTRARFGRRGFVKGSLAALACARIPHFLRPSDELRVGVVGLNGRGALHVRALRALSGVRVAALCDVDDQVLLRELRKHPRGQRPDAHADVRQLLEREDIDAVTLATPNHWHALQTIWACQAGKDVYVEAPATHAWIEGERVLAAARRHDRIVQSGFHWRASPALRAAVEWLRAGNLGAIEEVRAVCFEARPSIGQVKGNQPIPDSLDYDQWCGPAPLLALRRARLHTDWRWMFATGDGELGDRGAHVLDLARWVLGAEGLPASVLSLGGRFGYEDDGQTPNTQLVLYAYEPVPILLEVRGLPRDSQAAAGDWGANEDNMDDVSGVRAGVVVRCAGGTLRMLGAGLHGDGLHGEDVQRAVACDAEGREIQRWEQAGDPFASWVGALVSRRPGDLSAEIEVGLRSSALVHLGNVSQRIGRRLEERLLFEELQDAPAMSACLERMLAHLEANGLGPEERLPTLGPCLVLDPAGGGLVANERANALLAGHFREPYTLPTVG